MYDHWHITWLRVGVLLGVEVLLEDVDGLGVAESEALFKVQYHA